MRIALLEASTLKLTRKSNKNTSREFVIHKVIGNGAGCIAYRAIDADSRIPVIIKECFPRNSGIREKNGSIIWNSKDDENAAFERFTNAFNTQLIIQSSPETMNTNTHLIDDLYTGNNTLYSVSDIHNAKTYDLDKDTSLQELLITIRAITRAVGEYHKLGYLHLDIKPQNILILPETRDIIKLLDFDSVVKKADAIYPGTSISYTHEYAAPELLQGKRNKLCEATDIYSIGAILFKRIFERNPAADDRGTFSDWNLSTVPLFKKLSNKTKRLTKELLNKTISAS